MRDLWRALAVAIALVSIFALGYVINDLAEGITELPRHWWSVAPIIGLLVAGALATAAHVRRRSHQG